MTIATVPSRYQANRFIWKFERDDSRLLQTRRPHVGRVVSVAMTLLPSVTPSSTRPRQQFRGMPQARSRKA